MRKSEPESAQSFIEKAIKENRPAEYLLYGFCVVVFGVGISTIVFGALTGQLLAFVGSVPSVMIWPAIRLVAGIRRENVAIRLMEGPLREAKTAEEAARAISMMFLQTFGVEPPKS